MGKRRVIKPRFWVLMMTALVLVFACVYISQGQFIARQALRVSDLELARNQQLSVNAQLERKLAFSKTDAYVERVAHNELGLLKEGEIRYVSAAPTSDD